jgi:hypothetical protein
VIAVSRLPNAGHLNRLAPSCVYSSGVYPRRILVKRRSGRFGQIGRGADERTGVLWRWEKCLVGAKELAWETQRHWRELGLRRGGLRSGPGQGSGDEKRCQEKTAPGTAASQGGRGYVTFPGAIGRSAEPAGAVDITATSSRPGWSRSVHAGVLACVENASRSAETFPRGGRFQMQTLPRGSERGLVHPPGLPTANVIVLMRRRE